MTVILELPSDVAASLAAKAEDQGVSIEELVKELLVSRVMSVDNIDKWLDEAADLIPDGMPPLSEKALSRDSIYTREDDWNQ